MKEVCCEERTESRRDPGDVRLLGGVPDRAQCLGRTSSQETPCDAWGFGGFVFSNLTAGVEMTLRASAPGHVTQDFRITPSIGPQQAVLLELSPMK